MKVKWWHIFKTLFIPNFEKNFIAYLRTLGQKSLDEIEVEYEATFITLVKIATLKKTLFSRDFRKLQTSVKAFNKHLEEVSKKLPDAANEKLQDDHGKKEDQPVMW